MNPLKIKKLALSAVVLFSTTGTFARDTGASTVDRSTRPTTVRRIDREQREQRRDRLERVARTERIDNRRPTMEARRYA